MLSARRQVLDVAGVGLVLTAMCCAMTWPQAKLFGTHVAAHVDPYFSMWRLRWIAHALAHAPGGLFQANIFYPSPDTLAYSDATLLEGVLATLLFAAGVPTISTYNVLLFAGFVLSGVAMFVLSRHVTGSRPAALVGAVVFTFWPYRVEHFMHLELQWLAWTPLTLLFVHRAYERGRAVDAVAAGAMCAAQIISCVYYGVFLLVFATTFAIALSVTASVGRGRALRLIAIAAATAAVPVAIYGIPYARASATLGPRLPVEITRYSAEPINYLSAPTQNWLYGWTGDRFGKAEARLFPGFAALVLAGLAFADARRRREVAAYAVATAFAFDLSLGIHGAGYTILSRVLPVLGSLRSPARFGALVQCGIAVLASIGASYILRNRLVASRVAIGAILAAVACAEYWSVPMFLTLVNEHRSEIYDRLRELPPGVILELPAPTAGALPGNDPFYEYWSRRHWRPLVNGYSGFYPESYLATMTVLERFPAADSLVRLRDLGVRYIVFHRHLYNPTPLIRVAAAVQQHDDLRSIATVGESDDILELLPRMR